MLSVLQDLVDSSRRIVFFGGAGVSTESGIPDFRSVDGLYNQKYSVPPEEILSRTYFNEHTEAFFEFYRDKILHPEAKPNAAHIALARLEQAGKLLAVITQNIDGLHQMAGSKAVLELHGTAMRNTCLGCGAVYEGIDIVLRANGVPHCLKCGGVINPDVVLYEDPLDEGVIAKVRAAIREADLMIVGGTSLTVYPAASFAAAYRGPLVLINKSPTAMDGRATLRVRAPIGETLGALKI